MELFFLFLLIVLMVGALGMGYMVAFALPGAAIITIGLAAGTGYLFAGDSSAYFHSSGPVEWLTAGVTNMRGVYWEVERDTLIAIPLFIFMGIMLQRSRIAEDLLLTMAKLFGPVPGGLGISVIFVGALLAATTGIVGATVVAMGMISLPAMLRKNYSPSLATGTIAASGTLGQIIPPSIVLIILADQLTSAADQASNARKTLYKETTGEFAMPSAFDVTSTSAGEMFLGAFIPGISLVILYMLYTLVYALIKPSAAPSVPHEGAKDMDFWLRAGLVLFAPLTLIFLVLGSIIGGIATVNQAGAIGAAGSIIMAGYRLHDTQYRAYVPLMLSLLGLALIGFALMFFEMNLSAVLASNGNLTGIFIGFIGVIMLMTALIWSTLRIYRTEDTLRHVMIETSKVTSLVFIILLGAAILTSAFRAFGGEEIVRDFLNSLPGGFWTKFAIVMLVIFLLGFFLDFIEIAVVVVPIVAPILLADPSANITAVWLGVMIGINMQTSFLTPPFGFALFYLRGVAPKVVRTVQIYRGVIPFIVLQIVALLITAYLPPMVNYLPNRMNLLAETAPPPRNPKLEYCLLNYITEQVKQKGTHISSQIATARTLDLSYLPKKTQRDLQTAFDSAEMSMTQLDKITIANSAVTEATVHYRPLHSQVRELQAEMRKLAKAIDDLENQMSKTENAEQQSQYASKIQSMQNRRAVLEDKIPNTWSAEHAKFLALTKQEKQARRLYSKLSRQAFEAPSHLLNIIKANDEFRLLEGELIALENAIKTSDNPDKVVKTLAKKFKIQGQSRNMSSLLSKLARPLKSKKPNLDKVWTQYQKTLKAYRKELAWRKTSEDKLTLALSNYVDTVAHTLSAQHQNKLTREQALSLASCNSYHRDISLHF